MEFIHYLSMGALLALAAPQTYSSLIKTRMTFSFDARADTPMFAVWGEGFFPIPLGCSRLANDELQWNLKDPWNFPLSSWARRENVDEGASPAAQDFGGWIITRFCVVLVAQICICRPKYIWFRARMQTAKSDLDSTGISQRLHWLCLIYESH